MKVIERLSARTSMPGTVSRNATESTWLLCEASQSAVHRVLYIGK